MGAVVFCVIVVWYDHFKARSGVCPFHIATVKRRLIAVMRRGKRAKTLDYVNKFQKRPARKYWPGGRKWRCNFV
jgi:hypothetical protein